MLAGVVVGSMSLASAETDATETFTVISQVAGLKFIDLGAEGESPGDLVVFKDTLRDENQQERVGTAWADCTLNFGQVAVCKAAIQIEGRGKLTGTGAVRLTADSFTFPITGGTGDFANVSGWVRITVLADDQERFEFHLSDVG